MKRFVAVGLLIVALLGCGGGGGNDNSGLSGGETPITPTNIAGNWKVSTTSTAFPGQHDSAAGFLVQKGNNVSGTMLIGSLRCASDAAFTGTITGTAFTATMNESGQIVTLTGTATTDGNSISGSYSAPAGGCTNGDMGTFSGQRFKPLSGIYTGTLESFLSSNFQVTLQVAQAGLGQLSGSVTVADSECFATLPFSGSITGDAFSILAEDEQWNSIAISGTTNAESTQLNITYSSTGGACGQGGQGTLIRQTGPSPTVGITVSPMSVSVGVGQTQQFTASVTGTTNTAVIWQVNGLSGGDGWVGTITSTGLYTAPTSVPEPQTVNVTAISQADPTKTASAVVTITAVSVSISPTSAAVTTGGAQQFTATVSGTSNTGVIWQVNKITGGNTTNGVISTTGLYTAPATLPTMPIVSVIAVAQADTRSTATATVTITSPPAAANQAPQPLPIVLGTSGGNSLDTSSGSTIRCCSGTLGALVERAGRFYVLSANHVLARSDQALVGEPITQPGLVDNDCSPGTLVANLTQFVQLPEGGTSTNPHVGTVDAAIAQIVSGAVDTSGAILELETMSSNPNVPNPAPPATTIAPPAIGMEVAKAGRGSGLTCSTISSVNTIVDVEYSMSCGTGATFTVEFDNQVVISGESFSGGGDSGSLVVNSQTAQPIALLYAGDATSTVANPLGDALNALTDSQGNVPSIVGGAEHPIACPASMMAAAAKQVALTPLQISNAVYAKQRRKAELMSNPAVFGVGVGANDSNPNEPVIVLYIDKTMPYTPPTAIDGIPVKVQRSNRFRAWGWNEAIPSRSCGATPGLLELDKPILDQGGGR